MVSCAPLKPVNDKTNPGDGDASQQPKKQKNKKNNNKKQIKTKDIRGLVGVMVGLCLVVDSAVVSSCFLLLFLFLLTAAVVVVAVIVGFVLVLGLLISLLVEACSVLLRLLSLFLLELLLPACVAL